MPKLYKPKYTQNNKNRNKNKRKHTRIIAVKCVRSRCFSMTRTGRGGVRGSALGRADRQSDSDYNNVACNVKAPVILCDPEVAEKTGAPPSTVASAQISGRYNYAVITSGGDVADDFVGDPTGAECGHEEVNDGLGRARRREADLD